MNRKYLLYLKSYLMQTNAQTIRLNFIKQMFSFFNLEFSHTKTLIK